MSANSSNAKETSQDRQRLDLFLYRIRFFKTRALASTAISKKGARIERDGHTRRIEKPSTLINIGDCLSFNRDKRIITLDVMAMPHRRGPASEAAECYHLHQEGTEERD